MSLHADFALAGLVIEEKPALPRCRLGRRRCFFVGRLFWTEILNCERRLRPVIPIGALQGAQPRRFGVVKSAKLADPCIRTEANRANLGLRHTIQLSHVLNLLQQPNVMFG